LFAYPSGLFVLLSNKYATHFLVDLIYNTFQHLAGTDTVPIFFNSPIFPTHTLMSPSIEAILRSNVSTDFQSPAFNEWY
jgi:hypothetical protein